MSCPHCIFSCNIFSCPQYLGLSNEKWLNFLFQYTVCFNCLRSGLYANHCKSSGCKICKPQHNALVHVAGASQKSIPNTSTSQTDSTVTVDINSAESKPNSSLALSARATNYPSNKSKSRVLLATALIKVYDKNNLINNISLGLYWTLAVLLLQWQIIYVIY